MSFFDNPSLTSKLLVNEANTLHNCQHGGLLAVLAHFTASNQPAIVSLPTGSGKTELMFSIAFCLKSTRVLIIEPSKFLRYQTADRLRELKLFRDKILLSTTSQPSVTEVQHKLTSQLQWEDLRQFDAIIATPKTVSTEEQLVTTPPLDIFDIIFIDEGHHAASKTWRAVISSFPNSRIVLFTATAFRRDRKRLPGRLVYHYPIGKALDDKIYRPVEFLPIDRQNPWSLDENIAKAAASKLIQEKLENPDAALLIRTDRIANCEILKHIYENCGIKPVIIHSDLNKTEAINNLNLLRNHTVDAVVTVGMVAEGIDIPNLKLAALHSPPRSLPYTLQLIGRVSRTPTNQTGPACLIASPSEIRGETLKLFREDRDWKRFIPNLVEEAVRSAHGDRADSILDNSNTSMLIPEELKPYFSVEVYEFCNNNGKIHEEYFPLDESMIAKLPKELETIELLSSIEEGCTIVVTTSIDSPAWCKDAGLVDVHSDLHILYSPPSNPRLLFSASTSPRINSSLKGILTDDHKTISAKFLLGVLSKTSLNKFVAVGLENALGLTGKQPSYKVHFGESAATSIKESEGKVFGPGHAISRMLDNELRGIAIANSRIWAMKRASIKEFTLWCNSLASELATPSAGLPGLSFLAQPISAHDILNERPLSVLASDQQLQYPIDSLISFDSQLVRANLDQIYNIRDYKNNVLSVEMEFRDDSKPIKLTYRADHTNNWQIDQNETRKFKVHDPISNSSKDLSAFLNEFPPIIVMPNGGAIRSNYGWKILDESQILKHIHMNIIPFKWDSTDITLEADKPKKKGMLNVQEKTIEYLSTSNVISANAYLIIDDGAHEIADIIVIDESAKSIKFVHCKFSIDPKPGNRVKDWYELFDQCIRTHSWIRRQDLLSELDRRLDRRRNTRFCSSNANRRDFQELALNYKSNGWQYEVYAVQPGCDVKKLMSHKKSHVYRGLCVVNEWLSQVETNFYIWGHDS